MVRFTHVTKRRRMRLDRLIEARKMHHLTQHDLAEKIGVNVRQVARYENGENNPTIDVVIRIAKTLQISIDWLAGLSDDPQGRITEKDLTLAQRRLLAAYRGSKDSFEKLRDVLAAIAGDEELMTKRDE